MAKRKMASERVRDRTKLNALLEQVKSIKMTDEDWLEQEASFVYGNVPQKSLITKEEARAAVRVKDD